MIESSLRRLIDLLESSRGMLSIQDLARELDLSPGRVEGMVEFWIRKGRIQIVSGQPDCAACGIKGECSLAVDLPRVYELVHPDHPEVIRDKTPPCTC